jgi:hypothetical protein
LERALALSKSINSRRLIAQALHDLGDVAAATGDLGAAKDYYTVSLHRSLEIDFKSGIAGSLEGLAAVHFALGDARKAATLLGGAGRLEHLPVATGYFQPQIDAATAATAQRIREALGDKTAQQWMNHGALLTTDELAELAISR